MNVPYDPRYFIRISIYLAEWLLYHRRDFWICGSKVVPSVSSSESLILYSAEKLLTAAAQDLTNLTARFLSPIQFHDTESADPAAWPMVVSNAFLTARRGQVHDGRNTNFLQHYYYEHPRDVALWNVSMAIDAARERAGFTEYPEDCPLVVLNFNAFNPPGLRMESLTLLQMKLPHWNVRAPASLMMRATTPPAISVNTRGTGKRLVNQIAVKQSDFRFVCEFLGVPDYIYSREVPVRNTNKDYVNAIRRTNSSPCHGELG